MESNATPFLAEDLIRQILLRLPVRSLLRLKSVCKSWFTLISEPQFAKSQFDLAAAPTHRLVLRNLINTRSLVNFVDIENDSPDAVFSIPDPNPLPQNMIEVMGSCRGFLLLIDDRLHRSYLHSHFIIWNPSTSFQQRFDKVLPFGPHLCGIGYDSLTDDYVVVSLSLCVPENNNRLHCFSSRTNSWSCIETNVIETNVMYEYATYYDKVFAQGSFLNGAIHWLVCKAYEEFYVIIAFDVVKRRLSEIPLLHEMELPFPHIPHPRYLSILGGCLCLCSYLGSSGTEIWMMKEYKVKSSWTKTFVFSDPIRMLVPVCFTKNDEFLGRELTTKRLVLLDNKGELRNHASYDCLLLNGCIYTESLLSLPSESLCKDFEKFTM